MATVARILSVAALLCPFGAASGGSLQFSNVEVDGVGRVTISVDDPEPPADIGATDFTLEFWMRATSANSTQAAPCDQSGYHWIYGNIIFDRDRVPPSVGRDFGLAIAGGRIVFGVENASGNSYTICGSSNVVDSQWRHVAVQRRVSDGMLSVYVDGVLERSAQGPAGDISYPNGAPLQNPREPLLVIGREKYDFAGTSGFRGWIDEVRLSGRLRYSGASFPVPAEPFELDGDTLALYHLDETSGNVIVDVNGNASPATRLHSDSAGPEWSPETPFGATGQLRFAAATYNVGEGGGSLTVTVQRIGSTAGAAAVVAAATGGTATAGQDYQLAQQNLTWADGEVSKTFAITVTDDTVDESDETVVLTLSGATGATLGAPASATVTIGDDDSPTPAPGVLQLSSAAYPVAEGGGNVVIGVTRVNGADGNASVSYATAPATATPNDDYSSRSGTLSWSSGDETAETITVPIVADTIIEGAETFTVTLSNPMGATLGTPATATVTIDDDDAAPPPAGTLQLEQGSYSIAEGTANVVLRVTRTGGTNGNVSVNYATANGTAAAASDYTATSGPLTWANGNSTPRQIVVPISNDTIVEGDETFLVNLSGAAGGATIGAPSGALVTITDNDSASGQPSGGGGGGGSGVELLVLLAPLGWRRTAPVRRRLQANRQTPFSTT